MDTSEKQIIGENAKYVSDTIPQETKDGLRAHLKPGYAMPEQVVVSPSTGSLAAMAIVGVSWYLPP